MKEETRKRRQDVLISAGYYLLIAAIVWFAIKFLLPFFAPFLIGFLIAFALKPVSRFFCCRLHWNSKFCGIVVIFLAYGLLLLLFWLIGGRLLLLAEHLAPTAGDTFNQYLSPLFSDFSGFLSNVISNLSPSLAGSTNQVLSGLSANIENWISSLSAWVFNYIAQIGMKIPGFLVNLVFAVMASIFFSADYQKIASFLAKLFPKRIRPMLFETKGYTVEAICKYLRAYFVLMIITFAELCVGLALCGASNPIGIAAITAICDALPVLGTGIVLIPWTLLAFAQGNLSFAVSILIVYVVIGCVRNFLEPKILGKQLGLHPLATLLAIYIGMKTMGILGMILFPVALQIVMSLIRSGTITIRADR